MPNPQFQNQVVFVTGGAQGIGACIAESFCRAGASVAFSDFARACLFLASREDSGFITGQDLVVDGGMTVKMIYAP